MNLVPKERHCRISLTSESLDNLDGTRGAKRLPGWRMPRDWVDSGYGLGKLQGHYLRNTLFSKHLGACLIYSKWGFKTLDMVMTHSTMCVLVNLLASLLTHPPVTSNAPVISLLTPFSAFSFFRCSFAPPFLSLLSIFALSGLCF